jgi:predicted CXXCH cytochrome family protein
MKRLALALFLVLLTAAPRAQVTGDQLGTHDLSPAGASGIKGPLANACLYCHAPHGGMTTPTPLWNQTLSNQTYTLYGSSTYHQTSQQPPLGSPSKLCLSCHDGTVAPGQTLSYGQLTMSGTMKAGTKFGTDLSGSHPFSMQKPLVDTPELVATVATTPASTADPAVQMVNNNVECTTCHNPHFQGIDKVVQSFLVRDSSNGTLCLACHAPSRVVGGQTNRLAGWGTSIHATSPSATSNNPYVGGYGTVAMNSCNSCHMPHNAFGPARLLRGSNEQDCATCHNGSNTQPAAPNVFAEFTKVGHPFPAGNNTHDPTEAVLLNNNRHATCADCHNPHASQATVAFGPPPAVRASQTSVQGVSGLDGTTPVAPYAVNAFENCLRCHGTSIGKVSDPKYGYLPNRAAGTSDPLNVRLQLSSANKSSHPVTHDRSSLLPQPSLRTNMLKLDGVTPGRSMGVRVFCSDCHNADDARESGGAGANGPHGSKWTHILERRYEIAQAPTPGAQISNTFPNPDLTAAGPYGLCQKCHNLSTVIAGSSTFPHDSHVGNRGVSCSVCHSGHGTDNSNPNLSGQRLVNFDTNVVAPFKGVISYNQTTRSCTLQCHNRAHNNTNY